MRVIGGKYRSLRLVPIKTPDIRPTADRVRESLFNILGRRITGARVLDLFCGSGALGIESISRGASEAVFNDLSKESLGVLGKNLARLKDQNNVKIYNLDYAACLSRLNGPFDVVFIDPPYKSEAGISALSALAKNNLLAKDGVAVLERDRPFEGEAEGLIKTDERKYGITYITFFGVAQ